MSRWRLSPGERHAEVWRDDKALHDARSSVSPPAPPPSWRQIYGRLHEELHIPKGAFSPSHMVIGKSCQKVGFFFHEKLLFCICFVFLFFLVYLRSIVSTIIDVAIIVDNSNCFRCRRTRHLMAVKVAFQRLLAAAVAGRIWPPTV